MFRCFHLACLALCVVLSANLADAAELMTQEVVVAHRMPNWRAMHFDDADKARQHAAALEQLGAEVRIEQHNGHTDVRYRSVGWRPLVVTSDALAHQWQSWLKAAGFETMHGHAHAGDSHAGHNHAAGHAEAVKYRAANWSNKRFADAAAAGEFAALAKALGCQVEEGAESNVRFRCAEWMTVEFDSHKAALVWQDWLMSVGFEASHSH